MKRKVSGVNMLDRSIEKEIYSEIIDGKIQDFFKKNKEIESLSYFTDSEKLTEDDIEKIKYELENIKNYRIPENFNFVRKLSMIQSLELRDVLTCLQGYILVSSDWVSELKELIGDGKVLEVMAGCGSLSYALKQQGVNIVAATDDFSWKAVSFSPRCYMEVENIDCIDAVVKYGKDIQYIIMSWPYMDDTAYRVLKKAREINKDIKIIYIGEWEGGCTADDDFFDELIEIEDPILNKINLLKTKYYAIHDHVYLIK